MSVKRHDVLLKGALEDFFEDFLRMMFPNADEIFDFTKEFRFLEQEMLEISSGADIKHSKVLDKLVGVHLKSGSQLWVRVHIEVEKTARNTFGRRMFRYFSRLFDKDDTPVISIAVFLEKRGKNNRPFYNYSLHGTEVLFRFNSIYVAELDDMELSRSANPFAKILLITKLAIQKGLSVEDVFEKKRALARQLLALNLSADKIGSLLNFLSAYVNFEGKELNIKFEQELQLLTQKSETMGITEQILDIAEQKGLQKGIQKGLQKGVLEGRKSSIEEISRNLIKEGMDIKLIHKTTSMPLKQLEKLKKELLH